MGIATLVFTIATYGICLATGWLWFQERKKAKAVGTKKKKHQEAVVQLEDNWWERNRNWVFIAAFWVITAVAIFARVYRFWEIPFGLNQDEASIGYDSFAIGNFGRDRNGFRFPVYPIGFGNGHGPLYTYLSIPAIRIFGLSIFSVRLTNVVLSCVAAVVSYFLIKRLTENRGAALFGFGMMALAPTLIISARWALDGCPPPSLMIIGIYMFVRAIDSRKTVSYALTAAFFALVCYSYGPAAVLVVVFLPLSCAYLLYHKKITWVQLAISAGAFMIVIAPVAIFMAREMLEIPASNPDALITFPRFTGRRTDTVMMGGFNPGNFLQGLRFVIFQPSNTFQHENPNQLWDFIYNIVPGFGTTYLFTAPLIMFGGVVLFIKMKLKQFNYMFIIFAYFFAGFIMMGTLEQNVNRISAVYPAVVLLITLAVWEVSKRKLVGRYMAAALCVFTVVSFIGFSGFYFGDRYREQFGRSFFYSFGDALHFAMEQTDGTVYVTNHNQNMPGIKTLFYAQLPPAQHFDTVVYFNPDDEFRWQASFDRFIFGWHTNDVPGEVWVIRPGIDEGWTNVFLPGMDNVGAFLIDPSEAWMFDREEFNRRDFAFYTVMYRGTN